MFMETDATPRLVLDKTLYTAHATALSGREGRVRSDDGNIDLAVVKPRELGGKGEPGTNPEQLFAAGYGACYGSALTMVARQRRAATGAISVTAHVSLGPVGGGAYAIAVELVAAIPEVSREEGEELMRAAHQVCPYSNATRGNIAVSLRLA
jgi:osmotically inducible protein OsmC